MIQYDAKTFLPAPVDTPLPLPKPRIKKEKPDKPKIKPEVKEPVSEPTRPDPTIPAAMHVVNGNSKPTPTATVKPRQEPKPDLQKDLAMPPKVVPSKRSSDVSSSTLPKPEAKKPHLNGSAPTRPPNPIGSMSAPNRTTTNGNGALPAKASMGLSRPPPPLGRPPPPPPSSTRAPEDVLFIKKKKASLQSRCHRNWASTDNSEKAHKWPTSPTTSGRSIGSRPIQVGRYVTLQLQRRDTTLSIIIIGNIWHRQHTITMFINS